MSVRSLVGWMEEFATASDPEPRPDPVTDLELPREELLDEVRETRSRAIASGVVGHSAEAPDASFEPVVLPVVLHVAGRDLVVGRIVGLDRVSNPEEFLEGLIKDTSAAVERTQDSIDVVAETQELLELHGVRIVAELRAVHGAMATEPVIVRVLREAAGMTKAELARKLKHSAGAIDRIEAGRCSGAQRGLPYLAGEALGYSRAAIALSANEIDRVLRLLAVNPPQATRTSFDEHYPRISEAANRRCETCGGVVAPRKGPGRPRIHCLHCRPERRRR